MSSFFVCMFVLILDKILSTGLLIFWNKVKNFKDEDNKPLRACVPESSSGTWRVVMQGKGVVFINSMDLIQSGNTRNLKKLTDLSCETLDIWKIELEYHCLLRNLPHMKCLRQDRCHVYCQQCHFTLLINKQRCFAISEKDRSYLLVSNIVHTLFHWGTWIKSRICHLWWNNAGGLVGFCVLPGHAWEITKY